MNVELIDKLLPTTESSNAEKKKDMSIPDDPVLSEFKDCFSNKPGTLPTQVHSVTDTSIPPVIHPPRKIPVVLEPTKKKLKEMEEDGIIVKEDEHTPWVSSMLVVDKQKAEERSSSPTKDNVRICIDPRNLKKAFKRPHYPMPTVKEIANRLAGAQMFTTLDDCSGYWQLQIDDESSKLLTFNTP